eukprot:6212602-Pleurochrysis_carterae.AAC.1
MQNMIVPPEISLRQTWQQHKALVYSSAQNSTHEMCAHVLTSTASLVLCAPSVALCASALRWYEFEPSWLVSLSKIAIFGSRIFTSAAAAITWMSSAVLEVAATLLASVGACASASTVLYFAKCSVPSGEHTCVLEVVFEKWLFLCDCLKDIQVWAEEVRAVVNGGDQCLLEQVVRPAHLIGRPLCELRRLTCEPSQRARDEQVDQRARAREGDDLLAAEHRPQEVLQDVRGAIEVQVLPSAVGAFEGDENSLAVRVDEPRGELAAPLALGVVALVM